MQRDKIYFEDVNVVASKDLKKLGLASDDFNNASYHLFKGNIITDKGHKIPISMLKQTAFAYDFMQSVLYVISQTLRHVGAGNQPRRNNNSVNRDDEIIEQFVDKGAVISIETTDVVPVSFTNILVTAKST